MMIKENRHPISVLGLFLTILALTASNFLYQFLMFDNADYFVAIERAYFQSMAVLFAWLVW